MCFKPGSINRFLLFASIMSVCCGRYAWARQAANDADARNNLFVEQVAPILTRSCLDCHSGSSPEKGLRLDNAGGIRAGGESGSLIDLSNVEQSLLLQEISGEEPAMPAEGKSLDPHEVDAIRKWISSGAKIPENWVAERIDLPAIPWSFKKIARPTVPKVQHSAWPINEIDHFVLAELERRGLSPSRPADGRTLLRRLCFDVWGLPPSPSEVRDFIDDLSEDAYSARVDSLLSSPRYGERWARYWLDVVRYAESNGFETNLPRENAWHYRDYVIRAFNNDLPYDRFVMEQLAGDQLGVDEATGFLVAGPWDQVKSPDPVLTANQRADELHDMVSTTGSAFLGLTVGCARCHDHKFDPIRQSDYYALVACLAGVQHGERPLTDPQSEERVKSVAELRERIAVIDRQLWDLEPLAVVAPNPTHYAANSSELPAVDSKTRARRSPVSARRNVDRFEPVSTKWLRFTILRTNSLEPCIDELEVFSPNAPEQNIALADAGTRATASGTYPNSDIHRLEHVNDGRYGNGRSWISNESGKGWIELEFPTITKIDRVIWARDRDRKHSDRLALEYRLEVSIDHQNWQLVASSDDRLPFDTAGSDPTELDENQNRSHDGRTTRIELTKLRDSLESQLIEVSKVPMTYAGTFSAQPAAIHRLYRGDPMQEREEISPGGIASLSNRFAFAANEPESRRRLALADWILDKENPLAARVIVNRLWQNHFGEGLVSTSSDFGANGQAPTHPDLLDWLASELMDHRWSLKHIQKLILNSQTFRQSSNMRPECAVVDAASRFLWRFPPRRLEAEPIRDSILMVSGKLDLRMGGPGFDLFKPNDNYVRVYEPLTTYAPEQWRRMIYAKPIRQRLDGVFGVFDCPDGGQIAPKRNRSTTPLQALNLINSEFSAEQSRHFSERLGQDAGNDLEAQIYRAFALAFQRDPTAEEVEASLQVARAHGMSAVCRALFATNEFIYMF